MSREKAIMQPRTAHAMPRPRCQLIFQCRHPAVLVFPGWEVPHEDAA